MRKKATFMLGLFISFLFVAASPMLAEDDQQNTNTSPPDRNFPVLTEETTDADEDRGLFDLPLEQVAKLKIAVPAALTHTKQRMVPAAVTTIDQDMIRHSGARNLNEVFDIFVPNLQVMRHVLASDLVGIRGIINYPSTKYLLLVNGRRLNLSSREGAVTERDLPMLGDINYVNVVRGPGSVVYGPGAIAGVINIITYNGSTFEGTDISFRQGFVDQFYSTEVRHGQKLSDDSGIFLFYGVADQDGADQEDSPFVFSKTFTTANGQQVSAGTPVDFDINNDRDSYRGRLKHKLHLQYTKGDFEAWVRYTRGGQLTAETFPFLAPSPLGRGVAGQGGIGSGYQQLTTQLSYNYDITDTFNMDMRIGYGFADYEQETRPFGVLGEAFNYSMRESELHGRILGRWTPDETHALAFGVEYVHGWFGNDATGFGTKPTRTPLQPNVNPWQTNVYSPLAEYQWTMNDRWTVFLGARADKHTYTDWLVSPRAALVFTPNEKDTTKLIANQSVRRPGEDGLLSTVRQTGKFADEEKIRSLELRHERQSTEHLWWAVSAFYIQSDLVTGNQALKRNQLIGEFDSFGLEGEISYRTEKTRVIFSHGFTKLIDFELENPTTVQGFSAKPYGVGNDLANWSNHITKLYASHQFEDKWSVDGSLRVYWGFPGGEDLTNANNANLADSGSSRPLHSLSDPGHDDAFDASVFLNLGFEHRYSDNLTIRLDAINVLGWIDKDINKRNRYVHVADYRSEAAAFGITLRYTF